MKQCQRCGTMIENNEKYCPNCGEPQLNNQQNNQQYRQQGNGHQQSYQNPRMQGQQNSRDRRYAQKPNPTNYYNYDPRDRFSIFFMILSFIVPFLGFILYAIWYKDFPRKAKSCLYGAAAEFVFWIAIVTCCCLGGSIMSMQ